MPTRRAFLMTLLAGSAACMVFQTTSRLGKKAAVRLPTLPTAATQVPSRHSTPSGQGILISRAAWGAAEPAVFPDGSGEHGPFDAVTNPNGWLVYDQPLETVLNQVIIHHSALPLTDGPREIQRLHTEEKGFADIGYHYLINEKGQLFEGRSLQVRGAHTYGANYGSLGICLLGNFEVIQPTLAQLEILKTLLTDLIALYPLIQRLAGHRDYNPGATLCPGANLYPLLPEIASVLNLQYGV